MEIVNALPQSVRRKLEKLVFFFQAEDGIRDLTVTGVQTCALPICRRSESLRPSRFRDCFRDHAHVETPGWTRAHSGTGIFARKSGVLRRIPALSDRKSVV